MLHLTIFLKGLLRIKSCGRALLGRVRVPMKIGLELGCSPFITGNFLKCGMSVEGQSSGIGDCLVHYPAVFSCTDEINI